MGTGCCSIRYEGNKDIDANGLLYKKKSRLLGHATARPAVALASNYLSIPNTFSLKEQVRGGTGVVGLSNIENTCFVNSVFQCLASVQPLVDYFLSGVFKEDIDDTENEVGQLLYEYFSVHWSGIYSELFPYKLIKLLFSLLPALELGEQQDAQEFLTLFLDLLNRSLNRMSGEGKSALVSVESNLERQAAKEWRNSLAVSSSIIVDLFQGQLSYTTRCAACQHESFKVEHFFMLSLPVSSMFYRLSQSLSKFSQEEILGKQEFYCVECSSHSTALRKTEIWKAPPVLIFHLKKFQFEREEVVKKHINLSIPTDIDLAPFVKGPSKVPLEYSLFATIEHIGSPRDGHYIAKAKNKCDQKWYIFDDDLAQEIDSGELQDSDVYLLFYYNTALKQFYRQDLASPEHWPFVLSRELTQMSVPDLKNESISTLDVNSQH